MLQSLGCTITPTSLWKKTQAICHTNLYDMTAPCFKKTSILDFSVSQSTNFKLHQFLWRLRQSQCCISVATNKKILSDPTCYILWIKIVAVHGLLNYSCKVSGSPTYLNRYGFLWKQTHLPLAKSRQNLHFSSWAVNLYLFCLWPWAHLHLTSTPFIDNIHWTLSKTGCWTPFKLILVAYVIWAIEITVRIW